MGSLPVIRCDYGVRIFYALDVAQVPHMPEGLGRHRRPGHTYISDIHVCQVSGIGWALHMAHGLRTGQIHTSHTVQASIWSSV